MFSVSGAGFAQSTENYAVELTAIPSTTPVQITLKWKPITTGTPYYEIRKKAKTATSWGGVLATLTTTDSSYVDAAVIVDSAYEYYVKAVGSSISSAGYVYAGIKAPAIHSRGALIMLVDSTYIDSCTAALKMYMDDLSGDGWQIIRHDLARTRPDTYIQALISGDYSSHPNVKAAMIVGHLAVPYSSGFNSSINPPDGHVPQHNGAWPADVYYACFTGGWTDATVTETAGSYTANHNVPGDGKWDQYTIPSTAIIQVSRIDFYDMPSFGTTEFQKMRSYMAKDHKYKMDSLAMRHRGLISDNFPEPFTGEAFAANGWRNFAPLVGRDSITSTSSIISDMGTATCQWAYGCGPGSFTSAGGIGSTSNYVSNPVNGIFYMSFGSYFGDWNVTDNFLRAPLCSSTPALTNCWAARPNWFFHHMALGENIGYAAWLTHNNATALYQPTGFGNGWVHVGLMGDLTLRTDYIKPVLNLVITTPPLMGAVLNWTASPDPGVIGYYVYRADSAYGYFTRLTPTMITATTYNDLMVSPGLKYYMVRPVKLQSTPSGAYYNLGVGVTDTVSFPMSVLQVASVQPNISLSVFPNPAQNNLNLTINTDNSTLATLSVVNEAGQTFNTNVKQLNAGSNTFSLNVAGFAPGVYSVVVKAADKQYVTKWVKL